MNTTIKRVMTLTFFVIALTLFTILGISAETVEDAIAANKVAYIGTAEEVVSSYDTFADALAAVQDRETIYVINSFTSSSLYEIAANRSFQIEGVKNGDANPVITHSGSTFLKINSGAVITVKNLDITFSASGAYKCIETIKGSNFTLDACNLTVTSTVSTHIIDTNGTALIQNCTLIYKSGGSKLLNVGSGNCTIDTCVIELDPADDPNADTNKITTDILRNYAPLNIVNTTITDGGTGNNLFYPANSSGVTIVSGSTVTTSRNSYVVGSLSFINGSVCSTTGSNIYFDISSAVASGYKALIGENADTTTPYLVASYYKTMKDAFTAAATGSTVYVITDLTSTVENAVAKDTSITVVGLKPDGSKPTITHTAGALFYPKAGASVTVKDLTIETSNQAGYIVGALIFENVTIEINTTSSAACFDLAGAGASLTFNDKASVVVNGANTNDNGLINIASAVSNATVTFANGSSITVNSSARRFIRVWSTTGVVNFNGATVTTKTNSSNFIRSLGTINITGGTFTIETGLGNDFINNQGVLSISGGSITNATTSNVLYTNGGSSYITGGTLPSTRYAFNNGNIYVVGANAVFGYSSANVYFDAEALVASGFVARVGNTSTEVTLPGGEQPVTVYLSTDYHKSLTTAVSALTSGGTVYVIANITEQARNITVAQGLTIIVEGGSKTVTVADGSSYLFTVAGTLTVQNVTFICNGNFATASGTLTVGDNTVVEGIYGSTAGSGTVTDTMLYMTGASTVTIQTSGRLTNKSGATGSFRTSLILSSSDWTGKLYLAGTVESYSSCGNNQILIHTPTGSNTTPRIILQSGARLILDVSTTTVWCTFFRSDTIIETEAGATNILFKGYNTGNETHLVRAPNTAVLSRTLASVTFDTESDFKISSSGDTSTVCASLALKNVSFVSDTFANSLALQVFRINQNKNTLAGYTEYYTGYYSGFANALNVADNGDTVYVLLASLTTTGYTTGTNKTFTLEGVRIGGSYPVITHSTNAFMNVAEGSNVTVKNLTINATGKIGYATGSLTFENVTLTFTGSVYGFVTANATSGMTLRNCSLTVNEHSADNVFRGAGVHVIDGGSVTLNNTAASNVKYFSTGSGSMEIKGGAQITVTAWNGDLFSTSGTLHFNGATVNDGTANNTFVYAGTGNIILTDSGISTNRLIQLDANATMTVNSGSLTKTDSSTTKKFIVNNGTLNVRGGTVTVNAGASEAITSHGTLNISGGKLIAHNLSYSFIYIPASGTLNITGGYFEDDGNGTLFNLVSMELTMENATIHVKGGSDLFPDGTVATLRGCAIYMASESPNFPANPELVTLLGVKIAGVNSDTTATAIGASFRLGAEATSVSFGDTNVDCNVYYSYLEDALAAVTDSEATIYLVKDGARLYRVAGGITIPAGKTITLDGERRYAIVNGANTHTLFVIEQGGTLTLQQISLTSCPTRLADVQGTLTLGDGAHVIASASTGTVQETSPVITLGGSAIVTINEGASIVLDYADNDAHKVDSASAYVFMTEDDWTGTLTINGTVTHGWSVVGYSAIFYLQSNAGSISVGQNATVTQTGKAADGNAMIMSLNSADTRFTITEGATFTSVFPLRSGDVNATDSYTKRVLGYASISIDIYWGELVFVFTGGEWNTEAHVYDDGEWTAQTQGGDSIRIVNVGTIDVTATLSFTAASGFESVSGSFAENGATVNAGEEKTFTLSLTGDPEKFEDNTTIGRVTVTISDAQGGN